MATASSGTGLAESLKRVYGELHIPQNDIECLTKDHRIRNSQDLVSKRQRLKLKELVGVSAPAQNILGVVAEYVESKGVVPDPLANFTRKEYYEYLVSDEDMDCSAATDQGEKTKSGTKDDPICCDSSMGEEEAEGTATFIGSSSPNRRFLHGRLPITFVKIQGDITDTLGASTSSSNDCHSEDGKPKAKSFLDEPEGDEWNESEGEPFTESETLEDIDESDNFDLSEKERQVEMARIRDGSLNMMMQGFADSPMAANEGEVDSSTLEIKESYHGVDGLELRKGNCYHYQRQEGGSQVILGIVSFKVFDEKKVMAKCVLVVPYSVTFLGEEGVENPSPGGLGGRNDFFQVRKDLDLFPLSSFTGKCNEPTTIPKMIYEPKTLESPQTFGYVYDNKGSNRVGRRRMELRVLDLFCGAGGMHQGYKDVGFKTAMAVDIDPMAMHTFEANNPGATVYKGDVKQFLEDFSKNEDFRQRVVGRYEVVHASPPCNPFSRLNRHKTGEVYLANRELSKTTFIECIRTLDPSVAIYENVEGILQRECNDAFIHIVTELIRMGYQVRISVLKACDFGDAQMRRRLIIFAAKSFVLMPSIPMPTHGDGPNLLPYVTAKNVLEKLRSADPDKIPNILNCKITMLDEGVHGVVKLDANKFAPTVRAGGPAVLHYAEDRCLNVRENAALQGFHDDYKFFGNLLDMYRQVGNAVPLKLGTAIARSAKDSLEFEYEEELETTHPM